MLFVRRVDMNNTVLSKNNIEMKRIGWIVAIGLLLVISGIYYLRFSNIDSSNERIEDSLSIMDSKEISGSPSDGKLLKDSSIGVETDSSPNKNSEIEKSAITIADNKSSKLNSDTLNLRDFGVVGNGNNETIGFQKALNASVGKVLFIPKQQGKYYLTRQLRIPSNTKLVFDSNVIVQATDDLKQDHANFEVLFRIENANNINIQANNALFRMNKSAYSGEHNHIFMINGSSKVLINKARANNSGGDGFYIGAYKSNKKLCEDITITNSVADNNRRQGVSVISAKNLLIDHCVFKNTSGTSPQSGLDIEPNKYSDILENIVIKNCKSQENAGRGFMFAISSFDSRSKAVSINVENCQAYDNYVGFASVYFLDGSRGTISFDNCKAYRSKYSGFLEASCSSDGIKKIYRNCEAINSNQSRDKSQKGSYASSFYIFESDRQPRRSIGNSVFENCKSTVQDKNSNILRGISVLEKGNAIAKGITINNFQSKGHKELPVKLDVKSSITAKNIQVR